MFSFAVVLVLAALGLLIAGLAQGSQGLVLGSILAAVVAAVVLVVMVGNRRRQDAATQQEREDVAPYAGRSDLSDERADPAGPVRRTRATADPVEPSVSDLAARVAQLEAELQANRPPGPEADTSVEPPADLPAEPAPERADDEPGEEVATMSDAVLLAELDDEVLVVDGRPRYHLFSCVHLHDCETIPLPVREAREDGFTPCAVCTPDAVTAAAERARRAYVVPSL